MKICSKCGYESPDNKRICPKCGMPLVDATVRPDAEEENSRISIAKRMAELEPTVKKQEEEKEKKRAERKAEEAKKKEEAVKKAEEEALARILETEDEDDDSIEKTLESSLEGDDASSDKTIEDLISEVEKKSSKKKSKEVECEVLDAGFTDDDSDESSHKNSVISVSDLTSDKYIFDETSVSVKGNVCFMKKTSDKITINIEDDDDSLSCIIDLTDVDIIEHEDMSFTKEEIVDIVEGIKTGDEITVTGTVILDKKDNPSITVIEIEGEDFYVRCAD